MVTIRIRTIYALLILIAYAVIISLGIIFYMSSLNNASEQLRISESAYQHTVDSLYNEMQADSVALQMLIADNDRISDNIILIQESYENRRYKIANAHADSVLVMWHELRSRLDSITAR